MLHDDGFLCQRFHRGLLESQSQCDRFCVRVAIPELPPLALKWTWVGQTAGVAFWRRGGKIGAATLLLNGTECDDEGRAFWAAFLAHELPVPPHVWKKVAKQPKPVTVTLFYDLYSFTDPVIATAVPALGNAFFALFGTDGRG